MLANNHISHSKPFDFHTWSEHPEIDILIDKVWQSLGANRQDSLTPKGNRKGTNPKRLLKVLLVHLYSTFLDDPMLWTGVARSANAYMPSSRYNSLNISFKIVRLIDGLVELGYLEFAGGSNDKTFKGWNSFTSRIRPSQILKVEFGKCTANLFDIKTHKSKTAVILSDFDIDVEGRLVRRRGNKLRKLLEYADTDETKRMELMLYAYNSLISRTYIDIGPLEKNYVEHDTKTGLQRIPINQTNKFVSRIFSRGSWTNNGRFYGGFWQQVGEGYRKNILINDQPTIEVTYKGIHPFILSVSKGEEFGGYELKKAILPNLNRKQQAKIIKRLVLIAINSTTKQQAYRAFRNRSDILIKDHELDRLLDAFLDLSPHLAGDLFADKGVRLLNIESLFLEYVIKKFTYTEVPILNVHDSFIVQYDQLLKLKEYMTEASQLVLGKPIKFEQDIVDDTESIHLKEINSHLYNRLMAKVPEVTRSDRYVRTYKKFMHWIDRNRLGAKPDRIVTDWRQRKKQ